MSASSSKAKKKSPMHSMRVVEGTRVPRKPGTAHDEEVAQGQRLHHVSPTPKGALHEKEERLSDTAHDEGVAQGQCLHRIAPTLEGALQ